MQEVCSFLHKIVYSVICFSNEEILLMKIGYFRKRFFTNCDKMLNFVNFKNGGSRVHRRILDINVSVLSNLLMSMLTDTSAYL